MSDDAPTPATPEPADANRSTPSSEASHDPWAALDTSDSAGGPGGAVESPGVAPGTPQPPSVHDQRTVTSPPDGGETPSWANPFAPPSSAGHPGSQGNPFAPPSPAGPATPTNGASAPSSQGNPFAAPMTPAPQDTVPPPPVAPGGPGQVPYGYPGAPVAPGGYPAYPAQTGYGTPGQQMQGAPGYYGWPGMSPSPSNGMGTAGLVLGILSALIFCMWPLAIVLGILGVVFGALGRKKASRGEATNAGQALAGIICGATGIALGIGMIVLITVV